MFKADNELGRRYVRSLIELPLKNCAALDARLLRIYALPFAKSYLVGHVGW